jgi:hypothetical protein
LRQRLDHEHRAPFIRKSRAKKELLLHNRWVLAQSARVIGPLPCAVGSARKHLIIKEIQAAVARELAARSEVPKTMPHPIADLVRELHWLLREPGQEAKPSSVRERGTDERN